MMQNGGNDSKLKTRLSKLSPFEVKMLVNFTRRGISVLDTSDDTLEESVARILALLETSAN